MKKILIYTGVFCLSFLYASAQQLEAYKIFTREGKEVHFKKMMKSLTKAEIIFFGEMHNDPIGHWLELQVLKSLYTEKENLVLGMEMFEADDQVVLDEYLKGLIQEKHLLAEAKVWDNYKTDYSPLIEFAKEKKIKVVASNIPRRYANMVYRHGLNVLDSLTEESKKWIAPLPVEVDLNLPGYKRLMSGMEGHEGSSGNDNMAKSQAVKDATMAYFILKNRSDKNTILHINGAYHSQDGEGIIWYLKKSNPSLEIATIHMVQQKDISTLEDANKLKADFIICIPTDMTKTK